jgi:bisanhydrobacterioruberin hydratase
MTGIKSGNMEMFGVSLFTWIALIFYGVGCVGICIHPDGFIPMSAWNLLLMMLLLFLDGAQVKKAILFLIVGGLGWLMEWVGVHTGMPFGIYQYGDGLGVKVNEIPLIIGGNWILMTWIGVETVRWVRPECSRWTIAWLSALLMVAMDFLMEPVAPDLDYWMFQMNWVPVQNYLAWGWLGLIFSWVFSFIPASKTSFPVALALMQWVFFIVFNLVY